MAGLAGGLICASALAAYVGMGWSLAQPETRDLAGLPRVTQIQARELYSGLRSRPWSSDAEIRLGMFFLANNRPAAAAAWLQRALVWNPNSWQAWYYLGRAQRLARHFGAAQTAFKKVVALNPDYVAARVQMADLLLDGGLYDDAAAAYESLLRLGGDEVRVAESIANAQLRGGNYRAAARAYSQVLARFPSYGEAHAGLAIALQATGEDRRAAREQRLARNYAGILPVLPDDPLTDAMEQEFPTATSLFQQAIRDREPKNAIETLRKALALDPKMVNGWVLMINLYGQVHKPRDAEDALRLLEQVDPKNERGRYAVALALTQAGNRTKAAEYLDQALAIDPNDADAHRMLGIVKQLDHDETEAAKQYRTALEIDPAMAEAHIDLGLMLLKQGQTREAQAELLRALVPPCETPERMLSRELAALSDPAFEASFEQAVRAQAEEKKQPGLITLLNNRKRPAEQQSVPKVDALTRQ